MANVTRRDLTAVVVAAVAGRPLAAQDLPPTAPAPRQRWNSLSPREAIRERYFPNIELHTQEGRTVHLYDDLIKDKIMIINFMYATCDKICPRIVTNLVAVQRLLGKRVGRDVFFYSFTLDPQHDTPRVLKAYAAMHGVGPGWTFLTGPPDRMEMLR